MHPATDHAVAVSAAAEALRACRSAARALVSPASEPLWRNGGTDPDGLAGRLSGTAALAEDVASDVVALLARCDALIEAGTETRTEWMPKSVCGDDVTEWEPWNRPRRTPDAEALLPVAEDLRRFLARRAHVADLVSTDAALAVLRGDRVAE